MTLLAIVFSLLIALAVGVLLVLLLCPALRGSAAGLTTAFLIGGGLGLGVTSCLYFIALLTGFTRTIAFIDIGTALLLGLACLALFKRQALAKPAEPPRTGGIWTRLHLFVIGLVSLECIAWTASFLAAHLREPHGRWDAWLIWNMHARFLFRSGDHWQDAFASGLDWSHWDYPLLLPLTIARGWRYGGGEEILFPAVIGFCFSTLTLGLLWNALALLKDRLLGMAAATVLMGTPFFLMTGISQFADIPLAFFILVTLVLLVFQARPAENRTGMLLLAGLAAGLCAWTKNEGLLFLPLAAAGLFGATAVTGGVKEACRRTAPFLVGALPVLLIVLTFKFRLAPANELVAGMTWTALSEKLLDWNRYAEIVRSFAFTVISFSQGPIDIRVGMRFDPGAVSILLLAGYLLLTGIRIDGRDRPGLLAGGLILVLMLAGYFFVYLTTSHDLTWHLVTSLNRLFLQLWPAVIFLCFMLTPTPQPLPTVAPQKGEMPPTGLEPHPGRRKNNRTAKEIK